MSHSYREPSLRDLGEVTASRFCLITNVPLHRNLDFTIGLRQWFLLIAYDGDKQMADAANLYIHWPTGSITRRNEAPGGSPNVLKMKFRIVHYTFDLKRWTDWSRQASA